MNFSRRAFLAGAGVQLLPAAEPIIDIHQHTNYSGRTDEELIVHQRRMGVTKTVLLPAGRMYGLEANAGGNETMLPLVKRLPGEYVFFANELPDIPETSAEISKYLKLGAIGIGESKFQVEADSEHIVKLAAIAQEFGVPVLLHFQHGKYNTGFERFHKILARFPKVNFIGHAQTWWANIDKNQPKAPTNLYPKSKVTAGGITDRYLSDFPNMYADMSAGSGLNSLLRDEDHTREFLKRHQDKILYGSDCNDVDGHGEKCSGAQCIAALRRLAPDAKALRKILHDNAARVLKI